MPRLIITSATPIAACTAFLAKSRPRAASTLIGASTQKRICSPSPVMRGPPEEDTGEERPRPGRTTSVAPVMSSSAHRLSAVAGGLTTGLDSVDPLDGVAAGCDAVLGGGAVGVHPRLLFGRGPRDLALVVVALLEALDHGVGSGEHPLLERGQQLLLGEDEVGAVVVGQLVEVGHGQGPRRAGLDAQPAED